MKKALFFFAIAICVAACSKDYLPSPEVGTWELRHMSPGWGIPQDFATGNGNKYQFFNKGTYQKYTENKVVNQGDYRISITGGYNGYNNGTIIFTNPEYKDAFAIKGDTILIGTSIADGPTYTYVRLK